MGGMEWGTAFDGDRIYASITNHHHIPYQADAERRAHQRRPSPAARGRALDPKTGKILWQTADPQVETLPGLGTVGVWDLAPVTVANGILYASSMAKLANQNQMFALDAATGEILWQFGAGSSVNAGPAVVHGTVYWDRATRDRAWKAAATPASSRSASTASDQACKLKSEQYELSSYARDFELRIFNPR